MCVCVCVPRIGSSLGGVGFELPQHGSSIADHQRSIVFIDRADDHAVWPDCLCDSDGIALRTQVVDELVDTLLRV